jgi:cytosine/adenosine deaminase-related metal-dependent hydrolase
VSIGPLRPGSAADLLVLDYRAPTPLTPENLAGHMLYGIGARMVESVMVDGAWRLWSRRPLSVNPEVIAEQARETARRLWEAMAQIPAAPSR